MNVQNKPRVRSVVSPIGRPITPTAGQFAGRTLRAELHNLQDAALGRKYARKDRRPLDPPPIVQLKLFYIYNCGTSRQFEREVNFTHDEIDFDGSTVLCHVDVFPVPESTDRTEPTDADKIQTSGSSRSSLSILTIKQSLEASSEEAYITLPPLIASSFSRSLPPPYPTSAFLMNRDLGSSQRDPRQVSSSLRVSSSSAQALLPLPTQMPAPPPQRAYQGPIAYYGDFPIHENNKRTVDLVGATFVQSAMMDYDGRSAVVFVFADLAVRSEGTFILRYRAFDMSMSSVGHSRIPVIAECYGAPFRIYPTKHFPGLGPSTDLTKHVSLHGLRVNLRQSDRRRKKGITADPNRPAGPERSSSSGSPGASPHAATED